MVVNCPKYFIKNSIKARRKEKSSLRIKRNRENLQEGEFQEKGWGLRQLGPEGNPPAQLLKLQRLILQ